VFKWPSAPRHFQSNFRTQGRQFKRSDPAHLKFSPVADAEKRSPKPDWTRLYGQPRGDEKGSGHVPLVRAWQCFFLEQPRFFSRTLRNRRIRCLQPTGTWRNPSCLPEVILALGEFIQGRGVILSRIRWSDSIERSSTWWSCDINRSWKRSAA